MPLLVVSLTLLASAASAQQAGLRSPATPAKAAAASKAATPEAGSTRTRFIVGLERAAEARDVKISALVNPNRILIDLPQMRLDLPNPPGRTPVGVVKSFHHGLSAPGRVRVVIDVTGPVVIEKSVVEKAPDGTSDRLVLDIVAAAEVTAAGATEARPTGSAGLQPPLPKPAQRRASGSFKPVIVVDPGHGGEDSGARKFGTVEKDIVLSFSLKLRDKLAATGAYKVMMTRDSDVFIPLDERRSFAERNQAALFIAIHADYTDRASARGATIYSLRPQVADVLRRSAEAEMRDSVLSGKQVALAKQVDADVDALRGILAEKARDLIERNQVRTSVFARSVIDFVGSSTNLMENPDRGAAFVVLKTAKVPAILLELGYITNHQDAEQLNSDQWRDKVSSSVVTAINQYMHTCIDMAQC
ncbi:MAG TPA: N-acetylmuramoyl-L-alanine amidase [Hyphomicrobiaceae bacterium]|jgi:N-acetylmuramoyl-L-alanine amidase|nr:N-acetylmuramoyl-L-alanine amidase [Hyphomicrobiaceae bacterium]